MPFPYNYDLCFWFIEVMYSYYSREKGKSSQNQILSVNFYLICDCRDLFRLPVNAKNAQIASIS